MVFTKNFKNFVSCVLFGNPAANGTICTNHAMAHKGWCGIGFAGDSVTTFSHFTDTSNNRISGGICGVGASTNGYYGQQASLNKFDPDNNLGTSEDYKGNTYFKIGSGTTLPTEDDCNIENEISSSNIAIHLSSMKFKENDLSVLRFFVSATNTGTSPLTVTEIGMFKRLTLTDYSNTTRALYDILFGRYVLPAALTLNPNELCMFTVDIKF